MTPTKNVLSADAASDAIGKYFKPINLVDLGASYRFNKTYTLSFVVNNLLDQKFNDFFTYTAANGTNAQAIANRYQNLIPSRNYWISLSLDF